MSNFKELVRIGRDAVTRFTQAGKPVTGFSAAYDNGFGERKKTEWLDCSLWGERGQKLEKYLKKGAQIMVEGDIGSKEHEGKTYLTLDVRDVKLCGSKDDTIGAGSARAPSQKRQQPPSHEEAPRDLDEDEIPFITRAGIW